MHLSNGATSMGIDFTVFKGTKDGIVQATTHSAPPTGNQVLVKITHSGICGTDEHYREANIVLGHEGVGIVQQVGDDVKGFELGDVVGWGYTHKTCGTCDLCLIGEGYSVVCGIAKLRLRSGPILSGPREVRNFCYRVGYSDAMHE